MKYTYDETTKTLSINTPLVTDAEVRRICEEIATVDIATTDQVTDFITTAHIIICENLDGWGISAPLLKQIEKYLAAHFGAITFPVAAFQSVGKVQESYQQKVGLNMQYTKYGQMALTLDPTGKLDPVNKSKTYSISWLGMTSEERREHHHEHS